ncbi:MAG TPA: ferrochelatase, partial [Paracoccaceae bacterium]|nr:ferrochelatase [Paracoccaceae bacterium]
MTWTTQQLPADHPPVASGKVGVLIVNLGTPTAPTAAAVKTYLAEFLSDRRVVELPALIWQPILRGIILNVRPKKSAHAYSQVWTENGSPLAAITYAQAVGLNERLGANDGGQVQVDW